MKSDEEYRDKYYKEVALRLARKGYAVKEQKDGLLPVEWNGASLCRITAGGGAQYRDEELEPDGAAKAFYKATDIAAVTAEYMSLMYIAKPLVAIGLDGSYRLLAQFNDTVLAGHPTGQGTEFITWEWDYQHTGMWQGHYFGDNYPGAKQDFATRSGLIPQALLFKKEELAAIYHCCQKTRELDDELAFDGEQRIVKVQEHIEKLFPSIREQAKEMEAQQEKRFEMTM